MTCAYKGVIRLLRFEDKSIKVFPIIPRTRDGSARYKQFAVIDKEDFVASIEWLMLQLLK